MHSHSDSCLAEKQGSWLTTYCNLSSALEILLFEPLQTRLEGLGPPGPEHSTKETTMKSETEVPSRKGERNPDAESFKSDWLRIRVDTNRGPRPIGARY